MKLKIKYNDNINNNTNNLIISNIGNNINLLNIKLIIYQAKIQIRIYY